MLHWSLSCRRRACIRVRHIFELTSRALRNLSSLKLTYSVLGYFQDNTYLCMAHTGDKSHESRHNAKDGKPKFSRTIAKMVVIREQADTVHLPHSRRQSLNSQSEHYRAHICTCPQRSILQWIPFSLLSCIIMLKLWRNWNCRDSILAIRPSSWIISISKKFSRLLNAFSRPIRNLLPNDWAYPAHR